MHENEFARNVGAAAERNVSASVDPAQHRARLAAPMGIRVVHVPYRADRSARSRDDRAIESWRRGHLERGLHRAGCGAIQEPTKRGART